MQAFITGSQVYGEPTENSDVDVVIHCSKDVAKELEKLLGEGPSNYDGTVRTVKSGKINLILCHLEQDMKAWKKGTKILKIMQPVSSKKAKEVLDEVRGPMYDH